MLKTRKEILFVTLCGIFITSAIVAELISCKFIDTGYVPIIAGIVPWPIVFLMTDVMNEYFGKKAVRRLSWITVGMISFCFLIVFAAIELPTHSASPLTNIEFRKAFGNGLPVMIGSIAAFMVSQLVDVWAFWFMRRLTGEKYIWLRSTGSTVISQLVDSYTVLFIGFYLTGFFTFNEFLIVGITGYLVKLIIAICLTPFIYVVRGLIKGILGEEEAERLSREAAAESLSKELVAPPRKDLLDS